MATLESSIKLHDGMSRVLNRMVNGMNTVIHSFESMQTASTNCINTNALQNAQNQINNTTNALNQMNGAMNNVANANQKFNQGVGSNNLLKQALGIGTVMKAFQFAKESMDFSDVQRSSEIQLKTVLRNVGASADAFERLTNAASNIQSKGIYGDEAMIAGAAELATYVSDTEALEKMMGTLSNFAMGMSGGGALDPKQMVQYATQLGKAANGSYDGLMKKGFSLSEAQQEIIKNGTDMQKALVLEQVINDSWQDLYETMSNTPEGRLIQFNNAIGDMRENIGNKLYGAMDGFMQNALTNLPQVETVMNGIGNALAFIASVLVNVGNIMIKVGSTLINYWDIIAPIIGTATGALIFYQIATFNAAAVTGTLTAAWTAFNGVVAANPVVAAILAIVAALYFVIGVYNQITGSAISATGIIIGAFRLMFAFIWNGIAYVANGFLAFCEFLNNVFVDPLTAIQNLFTEIWNGIVALVGQAVGQLLKIMGNIPFLSKVLPKEFNVGSWMMSTKTIAGGIDNSKYKMGVKDYASEFNKGYQYGSKMFDSSSNPIQSMQLNALNKVAANTADTAGNTAKMKNKMDMNDTELKYLRDVAEREVLNRFTTAEIKLDMTNNNNISSDVDVNSLISRISDSITESMQVAAEGIHA